MPGWQSRIFSGVFLVLAISPCQAHDGHDHPVVKRVTDDKLYAATPMPDRILLSWKGDPARSQAITWRTDSTVHEAVAELALATDGPLFTTSAKRFTAKTVAAKTDLGLVQYHALNCIELAPGTLYVYRVGDGENWSPWTHFRTASEQPEPFTFVYFGDAQNDVRSHWSRVFREAFADAPRAAFMLHAGDLVNRGNRDAEWGEWCSAGGWVNASIPTVAIPGNHEYDIDRSVELPADPAEQKKLPKALMSTWQARFEFPENGPEEFGPHLAETAYYFDYQGVRIVGLNSMENFDVQAKWLRRVLADNPCRWTVVTHHHPVFSVSDGRDNTDLRAAWQPIYDEFHVDLVLQGHDHAYGRTELRRHAHNVVGGTTARAGEFGTMYVVSVSGPKMYKGNQNPFVRRAEDTQLYQVITVDGDHLTYEAKTATGKLYDAFKLVKRMGEPNTLIEQVPPIPENRRN